MAEENSELVTVKKEDAVTIFTGPKGIEKILADIKAEVQKHKPDTTTAKGRAEIASMAHKVSKAKVKLDDLGKDLVADWKTKAAQVDASRKIARDTLDALRDETRKPLTDWEEAEKVREENERLALKLIADEESAYADHAVWLRFKELEAKEAELNRIEAERLAKEEAARVEAARIEAERIKAEEEAQRIKVAEEKARLEAEEAARQKIAEAEAREIAAKVEAERQKQEAEAQRIKAEQDRILAEQRAKEEQEKAVKEAEEKARLAAQVAESNRLAAEETARR